MKSRIVFILLFVIIVVNLQGSMSKGFSYYNDSQYENAAKEFIAVLRDNPKSIKAYAYLAKSFYRLRSYEKIAQFFPNQIKIGNINLNDVDNARYSKTILMNVGAACLKLGQGQKAIIALSVANKLGKADPKIYNALGLAYLRTAEFRLAEVSFQMAINLEPKNYFYHNNLGAAYLELKMNRLALKRFEKSVAINFGYMNGWDNIWTTRKSLGLKSNRGWKSYSYFIGSDRSDSSPTTQDKPEKKVVKRVVEKKVEPKKDSVKVVEKKDPPKDVKKKVVVKPVVDKKKEQNEKVVKTPVIKKLESAPVKNTNG